VDIRLRRFLSSPLRLADALRDGQRYALTTLRLPHEFERESKAKDKALQ
jgi:hypothetical protein